jgi:uncharacterized membrane protein YqjE
MTEESVDDHAQQTDPADEAHHLGVFRGLFVSVVEAARTRLDLAAVEAELFLLRAIQMLLWAAAAVACALLALAFSIVAVVAALWDTHRMLGVLGGAGLFLVLAAISGWMAGRTFRAKPRMLEGTLAQLETDQHRASAQQ